MPVFFLFVCGHCGFCFVDRQNVLSSVLPLWMPFFDGHSHIFWHVLYKIAYDFNLIPNGSLSYFYFLNIRGSWRKTTSLVNLQTEHLDKNVDLEKKIRGESVKYCPLFISLKIHKFAKWITDYNVNLGKVFKHLYFSFFFRQRKMFGQNSHRQ